MHPGHLEMCSVSIEKMLMGRGWSTISFLVKMSKGDGCSDGSLDFRDLDFFGRLASLKLPGVV